MTSSTHQPPPRPPSPSSPPSTSLQKLTQFIRSELFPTQPTNPSSSPEHYTDDDSPDSAASFASRRREKVYTFVTIPKEFEKLMGYGFFQCADAFLYVFTFLPLRCVIALVTWVWGWCGCGGRGGLKPSDKCEMIKICILVVCSYIFMHIDTNVLYHLIKSQSVIKLYIFFNMLEVGDRLFGCFSQDTLDALFITATEQSPHSSPQRHHHDDEDDKSKKRLSTTSHAIICGLSILGHALVILLQSTTLSVAINASNRALLTVMMSNNFVELKGSVFKKFDKMNLFQVSCSDIRERFHLSILLLLVCLQTLREYSWDEARLWVLLPDCLMVLLVEIGVDWVKHAFITRFNELPIQVYQHYTRSLAYDMAESVKRKSGRFSSDHSDVVGRRLGFVPLPLAIVLVRVVGPMWRIGSEEDVRWVGLLLISFVGYLALASFRVLNMVVLVGKAVRIVEEHVSKRVAAEATEVVASPVKNSILKRTRTISGSDGDLYVSCNKSDKKLKFVDDNNDDVGVNELQEGLGKAHLFANSNVSLVSVGFNEEMLKIEGECGGGVVRGLSERKHSLGSNLDEGVMLSGLIKKSSEEEDLDKTIVEGGSSGEGDVVKEVDVKNEVVKDEVVIADESVEDDPFLDGSGGGEDESEESLNSSNTVVKKKKLMNWFSNKS